MSVFFVLEEESVKRIISSFDTGWGGDDGGVLLKGMRSDRS